eukprot:scaffold12169_cov116-Isochrysis_galbana.AAC.1
MCGIGTGYVAAGARRRLASAALLQAGRCDFEAWGTAGRAGTAWVRAGGRFARGGVSASLSVWQAARVGPMLERPAGLLAACTVAPGFPAGAQSEPCRWLDSEAVYACASRVSEGYGDQAARRARCAYTYINIDCAI